MKPGTKAPNPPPNIDAAQVDKSWGRGFESRRGHQFSDESVEFLAPESSAVKRTTASTLAELWLKLKKEGRSGQTAGNRAVKLGEYYVLVKTRCVRNRAG
jgi:hypothetical protein